MTAATDSGSAPRARVVAGWLVAGALSWGCAQPPPRPLVLASTTSTEDSGLLDVLIPAFEEAHPTWRLRLLAVGSGQALELGRRGDADVLLVHAPAAESAFVADGHGRERRPVMHNDFILVGPEDDPAGVAGEADAIGALRAIASAGAEFVSRGDDSGTHHKERSLWAEAGAGPAVDPGPGPWYLEAGQGMGEVLRMAAEKGAYALSDRGTFLALRLPGLTVLLEGDPRLENPYGVIPVTRAREPEGAAAFAAWITSPEAQALIGGFGVARFGRQLFTPRLRADTRAGGG